MLMSLKRLNLNLDILIIFLEKIRLLELLEIIFLILCRSITSELHACPVYRAGSKAKTVN